MTCLALILMLGACTAMKTPSVSGDLTKISGDTLCYRYANSTAKNRKAYSAEIDRRGLNCAQSLARDPLYDWRNSGLDNSARMVNH